jgi:hypothetical protein
MTTTTRSATSTAAARMTTGLVGGAVGGMAGGIAFGMLMQLMNVMPMIAMLVGSESIAVAWGVHVMISASLGALFGLVVAGWTRSRSLLAIAGLAYGVLWWVLGAMLLMPAKLGMPVLQVDAMAWKSLMGHMIFGVILGLVTGAWMRRAAGTDA